MSHNPSPTKYERFVELRRSGMIPARIAEALEVSTASTTRWDKRFAHDFPEEYAAYRTDASRMLDRHSASRRELAESVKVLDLREQVQRLQDRISSHEMPVAPAIAPEVTPLGKGRIGELLVEYRLLRHGFEVHAPTSVTGGTDLFLVTKGSRLLRIEVKSTNSADLTVYAKRSFMKDNRWQRRSYEGCKVDFFIFVDLIHENVFIVPSSKVKTSGGHRLTYEGPTWQYKDAYHLLADAVNDVPTD